MLHPLRQHLKVQSELARRAGYRPIYLTVFVELGVLESATTGHCQPSQTKIAERIGCCRATVNRAVRWLRESCVTKTVQLRVRQDNGSWFKGRLRYWTAKEPEQVAWLQERWTQARLETWAKKARRSRVARCNIPASTPLTPLLNSDTFFAPGENLASPALQRLMKQAKWRS